MIVRTVLAVALALALIAISQPAIQGAARERTAADIADEVDRFVERAEGLVDTDDAVTRPGARRIVRVNVPESSRFAARVDEIAFEPEVTMSSGRVPSNTSAISWTVDSGDRHRRILDRIRLATETGDPLRLAEPGDHRLVLSLRGSNADPVVHVQRYDARGEDRA